MIPELVPISVYNEDLQPLPYSLRSCIDTASRRG